MGSTRSGRRRRAAVAALAAASVALVVLAEPAAPPVTASPTTAPAGPPPTLLEPESEEDDPVRGLVPWIVASPDVLRTRDERVALIRATLEQPRNDIAVEERPGSLCAVMRTPNPVMAAGRWERNGEPFRTTDLVRRNNPGFGICINTGDGEPFDEGVYQFVAIGATGVRSVAATLVVGATRGPLWLLNDTGEPVCLVLMSPKPADYFESYQAIDQEGGTSPLRPGQAMAIPVAMVDQHVQIYGCPPNQPLRSFDLSPEARVHVPMLDETATTTQPTTTTT